MDPFAGLITLRKLCNHPDLVNGGPNRFEEHDLEADPTMAYGWYKRSGKMVVVRSILDLWRRGTNKTLLFSQSRQMLDILETLLICEGYSYLRMDGSTSIGARQKLVHDFNQVCQRSDSVTIW